MNPLLNHITASIILGRYVSPTEEAMPVAIEIAQYFANLEGRIKALEEQANMESPQKEAPKPNLMLTKNKCPDDGACHHHCTDKCFRVLYCEPLTSFGVGHIWPEEIRSNPKPQKGTQ